MRPGQRPTGPGGAPPVGKAEPGKPIYERKPASRARPTMDRRFEEGERKLHPVRARPGVGGARAARPEAPPPVERPRREITITEGVTVRELAEKLDVRAKDLLKVLLDKGVFASINQALDTPTATTLAEGFNGVVSVVTFEEEAILDVAETEKPENLVPRPPVVTVMGHVDHGKTSLLDAIRETDVAGGEAGGITQHIGAYSVNVHGRKVVFIDTPGHEAFTRMRARGAKVTDIVVLVVAADDGVMPQTAEAIDHSKAAKVPIIVAVNKMDKPGAESEKIKRQLSERGLMSEEWGGDTIVVEVSAKLKKNLEKLLEMILLVADMRELKANPSAVASGTVLESRVDRGRGPVATVLVQNGTLSTGDFFLCGAVFGKVRAMFDDKGHAVKERRPVNSRRSSRTRRNSRSGRSIPRYRRSESAPPCGISPVENSRSYLGTNCRRPPHAGSIARATRCGRRERIAAHHQGRRARLRRSAFGNVAETFHRSGETENSQLRCWRGPRN